MPTDVTTSRLQARLLTVAERESTTPSNFPPDYPTHRLSALTLADDLLVRGHNAERVDSFGTSRTAYALLDPSIRGPNPVGLRQLRVLATGARVAELDRIRFGLALFVNHLVTMSCSTGAACHKPPHGALVALIKRALQFAPHMVHGLLKEQVFEALRRAQRPDAASYVTRHLSAALAAATRDEAMRLAFIRGVEALLASANVASGRSRALLVHEVLEEASTSFWPAMRALEADTIAAVHGDELALARLSNHASHEEIQTLAPLFSTALGEGLAAVISDAAVRSGVNSRVVLSRMAQVIANEIAVAVNENLAGAFVLAYLDLLDRSTKAGVHTALLNAAVDARWAESSWVPADLKQEVLLRIGVRPAV